MPKGMGEADTVIAIADATAAAATIAPARSPPPLPTSPPPPPPPPKLSPLVEMNERDPGNWGRGMVVSGGGLGCRLDILYQPYSNRRF